MRKHAIVGFALVVSLVACNQEMTWRTVTPESESPIPGVLHNEDCWDDYEDSGLYRAIARINCCMDNPCVDASSICHIQAMNQAEQDVEFFYRCLSWLPTDDADCLAMLDPEDPESDADGDGVMDMVEIKNKTNPCHVCTYGPRDCDGEMDYDHDGIPNNIDPVPGCGNHCYGDL